MRVVASRAEPATAATATHAASLIALDAVSVDYAGKRALRNVTWRLEPGQHWAIVGPNGSGKSTFLRLIRGEIWPAPVHGGARWFGFEGQPTQSPIGVNRFVAMVGAEQQTRYARTEWDLKVWQVVHTGIADTDLIYGKPTAEETTRVDDCLAQLGISNLRDAPFRLLSQGQLRKVLVARALIRQPRVLLCDEIGVGLDPASRRGLYDEIERVARTGTQVLMVSHRREEFIPSLTHELVLHAGKVTSIGPIQRTSAPGSRQAPRASGRMQGTTEGAPLIEIRNADVAVDAGRLVVLRGINWSVSAGHHWFVTGPNGAGKTTLLRLLLGELGVGHGGSITRFGDEQLDGIWEIKKRIGYVSPELQTRYAENHSARDVIATGFSASVGWLQPITAKQKKQVNELLALFGLEALADRGILHMSYGQARKVLLARALANQPRLLLLDEAFDGLDAGFREDIARVLEQLSAQTSVVLVSHYEDDRLPFITHQLTLDHGRIVARGEIVNAPARRDLAGGGRDKLP